MNAVAPDSPGDEFLSRLREETLQMPALAAFLDALSHAERVVAVRRTRRTDQRRLWQAADGFAELALEDLVPAAVPAGAAVRHFGKNTLPVFTHFEKRFLRPEGLDPRKPDLLYGYNHQSMAFVTGPGYYVARQDPSRPEVLVDYNQVPPEAPEGWPPVRRNESGLGRFVYGFMVDTLRRVSEHVTIGSAAKNGRDMGSWFLLTREP
jgi:hypothetical protein